MEKGVVKMVDPVKAFGFIVTEDEDEVYFHFKDVHPKFRGKMIKEGTMVGFDLKREMKGDRASNIRLLEE